MNIQSHKNVLSRSISHRYMIWLVSLSVLLFLIWSRFAALDEIVRGPGKVIPSSKTQIVQSLEGGILSEMRVREGDEISAGSIVAKLSDTKFKGAFYELKTQYLSLQIKLSRLSSELEKAETFNPSNEERQVAPKVATSEVQLFRARMQEYKSTHSSLYKAVALRDDEMKMLDTMAKKGVVPTIDVIKAKQYLGETQAKIDKLESDFTLLRAEEYADTLNELKMLEQQISIREDQLKRTTLISPVRSIVNKVHINTIGGVVAPGDEILELTPLDDELRIEAKINPKDIAFVYPGMSATIKLSAYDYTIFGSFKGSVKHISADTFDDDLQRDETPYYKVEIEVDPDEFSQSGEEIVARPGMQADVELQVGDKTVLEYLLKPLFKTSEAMREP